MNAHSVANTFLTVYNAFESLSTGFCRKFQTVYSTIPIEKKTRLPESNVSGPFKGIDKGFFSQYDPVDTRRQTGDFP